MLGNVYRISNVLSAITVGPIFVSVQFSVSVSLLSFIEIGLCPTFVFVQHFARCFTFRCLSLCNIFLFNDRLCQGFIYDRLSPGKIIVDKPP